ncbi:MAG TPA: Uma2 family endonuclease [Thermoanaerobaculia bacterium]|jgi:Uma2 family endonuclease|nr:Uma2 family endonuclease [Thermoanaerobaculia bacterium]
MAEPVRKPTETELLDEEPGITLQRWVERPGGRMELVEMPLTPELFLNPQVGDHMSQGKRHGDTARQIADLLDDFFLPVPDVLVTFDLKFFFGPGLDQPSPDVSVIRGVRDKDADRESFDVIAEGVRPCLIIEVVSPLSSRIRKTDLEDKVALYRRVGIPEYLIVDCQRRDRRFRLIGYRLSPSGYRPIEPDGEGRVLSETTGLWFQVTPDGNRVRIFEHPSGQPLLTREENKRLRREAEEARKVIEDENSRLRAEIDRLRKTGAGT